jgi:DNA-directed RNA polymerase subunit RPC12/RpoP
MENKEVPLNCLNYGQKFVISGLKSFKNTRLVRCTDCSAVIAGERLLKINDKEIWTQIPSGYTISPFTMVVPV